jgi:putative inorganic carbon (HCO3(-)) transporter
MRARLQTWLRTFAVPALHGALLLAIAPSSERPFSAPKLLVLVAGSALLALASARRSAPARAQRGFALRATMLLALLWLGVAAISGLRSDASTASALLLDGSAALLLFTLLQLDWDRRAALGGLALLGTLHAGVVLLQALHLDPLRRFGLDAQLVGARMGVYGLLGNPDFAAAWLGAVLAITIGLALAKPRWLWLCAIASIAQLAALACTRSLGALISLAAALLMLVISQPMLRKRIALFSLPALLLLALGAVGRDPLQTARGRLYLDQIGLAQLRTAPLLGQGPGSVGQLFPGWEAERFSRQTPLAQQAARPFAAAQDHLHQDFLERLVEQGLLGVAVFIALLAIGLKSALVAARRDPLLAGCAAAIASLAARSLFDFPAARPAELALLVTLIACAVREVAALPTPLAARPHAEPPLAASLLRGQSTSC